MPNSGWMMAAAPRPMATIRSAIRYGLASNGSGRSAERTVFLGTGSAASSSPAITLTLILPARRTRSCTTEPRVSSNHQVRCDFPMMIWVTLLACAKPMTSSGDAASDAGNGERLASQRLGQAQRIGQPVALLVGQLQAAPGLDADRGPGCMQGGPPAALV